MLLFPIVHRLVFSAAAVMIMTAAALWHPNHVTALAMPSAASMTRRAIDLSNKANIDPSYANEACELWSSILNADDADSQSLPLPMGAMPVAHGIHASTLVRVGRDKDAIIEYQKALSYLKDGGALSKPLTKEEVDIRMGMGNSFQRLLRYREAANTFLDVSSRCLDINGNASDQSQEKNWVQPAHLNSLQSAALCFMRTGNLDAAISTMESFETQDANMSGILGALLLIQMQSSKATMRDAEKLERVKTARELLHYASNDESTTPLYNWLYLTTQTDPLDGIPSETFQCLKGDIYLAFAKINNSPFDDPGLVNLDDKILLHSAVMDHCHNAKEFWPQGYILPQNMLLFMDKCKGSANSDARYMEMKNWILKERSGYGSHGNSIASANEAISMYDDASIADPILCQRIVEPPMLIGGRKFSLRVYVIYFPGGKFSSGEGDEEVFDAEIYVSNEGLVKYASASFDDEQATINAENLDDQYMTNSGRGDGRSAQQQDLRQLQSEFEQSGINYENMWNKIEQSIQVGMKRYFDLQRKGATSQDDFAEARDSSSGDSFVQSTYAPLCHIPKIMGFDYILDSSANPYLLEVNRFPGLEPRSSMDSDVKHCVVYDAWIAASERMRMPKKLFDSLRPLKYKGKTSLKKLSIT